MNKAKIISLEPVNDLVKEFNEVSIELSAFINWAQNIQESGLSSTGSPMSKLRIIGIRKKIKALEKKCKPAREALMAIKESGHFDRRNLTPIHFNKGNK